MDRLTLSNRRIRGTDIVCKKGELKKVVRLGAGDSYSYRTQAGKLYAQDTKCLVLYKKKASCEGIRFSCTVFKVHNKKAGCTKPDRMLIMADGVKHRFCQRAGPDLTSAGDMRVIFLTDRTQRAPGAQCTAQCTTAAPTTAAPTPPPPSDCGCINSTT